MRTTRTTLALWTTVAAFAFPVAQAPAAAHSDRSSWSPRVHRHVVAHHPVRHHAMTEQAS